MKQKHLDTITQFLEDINDQMEDGAIATMVRIPYVDLVAALHATGHYDHCGYKLVPREVVNDCKAA